MSSLIVGIGKFLRVVRRCTRGSLRMVSGEVVLREVDGVFTLGGSLVTTLAGSVLRIMVVRRSMISLCLIFACAVVGVMVFRALRRSLAARSERSLSAKAGALQWVG